MNMREVAEQMRQELLDIAQNAYAKNLQTLKEQHQAVVDGINQRFGVAEGKPEISEDLAES